jgi:hypothetical protein
MSDESIAAPLESGASARILHRMTFAEAAPGQPRVHPIADFLSTHRSIFSINDG